MAPEASGAIQRPLRSSRWEVEMPARLQGAGFAGRRIRRVGRRGAVPVFVWLGLQHKRPRAIDVERGVEAARFVQGRRRRVSLVEPGWLQRQAKAGVPWTWLCSIRGGGVCGRWRARNGMFSGGQQPSQPCAPGPTAQKTPSKPRNSCARLPSDIVSLGLPTVRLHCSHQCAARNNDQQGPHGRRQSQY